MRLCSARGLPSRLVGDRPILARDCQARVAALSWYKGGARPGSCPVERVSSAWKRGAEKTEERCLRLVGHRAAE
jgi:hypothetical protein